MDALKYKTRSLKGFTYIELIAGIAILMLGVSFIVPMYGFYGKNKIAAREYAAMAAAAQNGAEIVRLTGINPEDTVRTKVQDEIRSEGFTGFDKNANITIEACPSTMPAEMQSVLKMVTITIPPKVSSSSVGSNYTLKFYVRSGS